MLTANTPACPLYLFWWTLQIIFKNLPELLNGQVHRWDKHIFGLQYEPKFCLWTDEKTLQHCWWRCKQVVEDKCDHVKCIHTDCQNNKIKTIKKIFTGKYGTSHVTWKTSYNNTHFNLWKHRWMKTRKTHPLSLTYTSLQTKIRNYRWIWWWRLFTTFRKGR